MVEYVNSDVLFKICTKMTRSIRRSFIVISPNSLYCGKIL